jgi:hypothetical protein
VALGGFLMPAIFDALPGLTVPIGSVLPELAALWEMGGGGGKSAPSEYRASQMTFVLHFGMNHSPETGRETFDSVMRFAQRYPCRIVALCPRVTEGGDDALSAKVFAECYIGRSRQEMSCCEAIIVGYPDSQRGFLENQVTTLMENDLPLYYWPSRIQSSPKLADYGFFLKHAKRIVIDSATENQEIIGFAWPKRQTIKDLAEARLLQVRQSIGQFLSSFGPGVLVNGLQSVEVAAARSCRAEARSLSSWVKTRIEVCRRRSGSSSPQPEIRLTPPRSERESMAMRWVYASDHRFLWMVDLQTGRAHLEADLGAGEVRLNSVVRLLSTSEALGEALFF